MIMGDYFLLIIQFGMINMSQNFNDEGGKSFVFQQIMKRQS